MLLSSAGQRRTVLLFSAFLLLTPFALPARAQEERWHELTARVEELHKRGKYAEAIPVAQQTVHIAESTFGPDHPNVASSLNDLALMYTEQGQYAEAEPLYKRALAMREKALGPEHTDVAKSLSGLGVLYLMQGRTADAEPLIKRALSILEKALGPDHPDVAATLNNLGGLYDDQGRYANAEPLFQRALTIREKALGPMHPDVAESVSGLALVYYHEGRYEEAESHYKRALAIFEKALGAEHPSVGVAANNLAALYDDQGRYAEAEQLYKRALAIVEKALGPDHPDVGTAMNNLGQLYYEQGRYADAETFYNHALKIHEKALGPDAPDVGIDLNNLAGVYDGQKRYEEAETLYKRALTISEKVLGPEHPEVATSLNNLAELYRKQRYFSEAEALYKRALAIREKVQGPEHPDVAMCLNNLAELYREQHQFSEAEPLFHRALAIREKAFGPEHPTASNSLNSLAVLYYQKKSPQLAANYFDRSLEALTRQFDYYFSYMSEKDRLAFLNTVSKRFPDYFNFCLSYRQQLPDLPGKMYDVILWEKGFVAQSVAAIRAQISSGGDKEALGFLDQLTAKKTQLARLLSAQPSDREQWRKQVDQLEQEANSLEQQLVRRSAALTEQKKLAHVSWRDVQKTLKQGEAAVEFVRFPYFDGEKATDKFCDVALVVTPENPQPTLIVLVDGKNSEDLEKGAMRNYRQRAGLQQAAGTSTTTFYDVFWKPLEPSLATATRIYLSPDGLLNQVSLGVVPDSTGKLLLENYDLRVVNSTKDILREKRGSSTNSAVLVGNPDFSLEETKQRNAKLALQKGVSAGLNSDMPPSSGMVRRALSRELVSGALPALPGTQVELTQIDSLLEKQKWQVQLYTGQQALKDSVTSVQHPRVLHIATHGFFQADQNLNLSGHFGVESHSALEDPMLRSGLFFAGANRTLAGQPASPDLDDGILTSYEATGLNLQGTELVVLSACGTGLGQVSAGEGVFGLRRALQVAGAEAVLLSMWSVPDRETQELMTLFYSNWLAGQDKHEALRKAQLQMRKTVKARYGKDSPFHWGAFVLVGE